MKKQIFTNKYYTEKDLQSCGFKNIGKNVSIHEKINISGVENISIGSNVRIDPYTNIVASGPIIIGSHIHIGSYCLLQGAEGIVIEDFCTLSHGVKIFTRNDDYSGNHLASPMLPAEYTNVTKGSVIIRKHAIIGSNSVILPNIVIEEGCSVGALSFVKKSLQAWNMYAGVPVRKIGNRSKNLLKLKKIFLHDYQKTNFLKIA
jgi:galactoside O-acetyltransferase